MTTGSKAPRPTIAHRYAPRVVIGGSGYTIRSGCSCGWTGAVAYRGMARDEWKAHRKEATS